MNVQLSRPVPKDAGVLLQLIQELAESEGVKQVQTSLESLQDQLFGAHPTALPRLHTPRNPCNGRS